MILIMKSYIVTQNNFLYVLIRLHNYTILICYIILLIINKLFLIVQELENILQTLTKEVNELHAQPNKSQPQPQPQISITKTQLSELRKRSLSPITRSIKPRVEREHLEPINKMFKKTLHVNLKFLNF